MNMTTLVRRIHLFSGLFLLAFVAMYFATGWLMTHGKQFPRGEGKKETRVERLAWKGDRASAAFREHLEAQFGVRGKRQPPRERKDGWVAYPWAHPGEQWEVVVSPKGDEARVTRTTFGAVGVAHGLHRLHGYGGGAFYDAWAFVYDLASGGMIAFALSGIWLWHRSAKARWPGWLCLALGCGYTAATVLGFMFSR